MTKKSKKTAEKTSKKAPVKIKRISDATSDPEVQVEPVVDTSGAVVMRSVDDPGETVKSKGTVLKPSIDKETGVLTMVPVADDLNK
jgi:hypothetical protein